MTIFQSRLEAIAEEMSHVLRRTAYSPNIKERADFSCAIFDNRGRLLAQAEAIPVHLGSMPFVAKPILELYPNMKEGDAIVTNSPRAEFGGTHLPDITVLSPVFINGKLMYIVANRAHHADVGGMTPGSLPASSSEIFQEGLIIPPVYLFREGKEQLDMMKIIMENVRTPTERRGDLRAQYSALQLGLNRLKEMIEEHPNWDLLQLHEELLAMSEAGTRRLLGEYKDFEVEYRDYMDDDGTGNRVGITCHIIKKGGSIDFDFTNSDDESSGNINAPLSVTTSACYYFVRLLTGRSVPTNSGCFAPVNVKTREGSVVNPSRNAATSSANTETSTRIVDVIHGALAQVLDLPGASQGTMNNLIIGGVHEGKNWSIYETIGGGTGGGSHQKGCSAIQSHMTNTENTPIEALELAYPLRVREFSIRRGSGGKGTNPGGDGIVREIELLDTATINIQSDRRKSQPFASGIGEPGASGKNIIIFPQSAKEEPKYINENDKLESNRARVLVHNAPKGTVVRIETPGGGGWRSNGESHE